MQTFLVALSLWVSSTSAEGLQEPRLDNAQTLAMGGASQANTFSNIAMLTNPAAVVFIRRYSLETAYFKDPALGWSTWITSVLDSSNGAFSGGITYVQNRSDNGSVTLHQVIGSSGFALGKTLALGFNVRRLHSKGLTDGPIIDGERYWSTDTSLALRVTQEWILGWSWKSAGKRPAAPLPESAHTISTSWLGRGYTLSFDAEIPRSETMTTLYKLGAEYFISPNLPTRAGWNYREQRGHELALGLGWIEKSGAIDLALRKDFYGQQAWIWSAGLRLFY